MGLQDKRYEGVVAKYILGPLNGEPHSMPWGRGGVSQLYCRAAAVPPSGKPGGRGMRAPPSAVVVVVVVWYGCGQATTTWVCKHNSSK
jgi:hypothetical protein